MLDYADGPVPNLVRFSEIAGVPIHYARPPVSSYGSIGVPRTPRLDKEFLKILDNCFERLWQLHPQGVAKAIVSGGCYVDKAGSHGVGRAIDIDALWWDWGSQYPPIVTGNYPRDRKRYLALEAHLRKYFGLVLDYHYNAAHQDHFHVDDTRPVGFFPTPSRVVFVQAALLYVFGKDIKHDGIWGPKTDAATRDVTSQLDTPDDIADEIGWLGFLDAVTFTGFGCSEKKETASAAEELP